MFARPIVREGCEELAVYISVVRPAGGKSCNLTIFNPSERVRAQPWAGADTLSQIQTSWDPSLNPHFVPRIA